MYDDIHIASASAFWNVFTFIGEANKVEIGNALSNFVILFFYVCGIFASVLEKGANFSIFLLC